MDMIAQDTTGPVYFDAYGSCYFFLTGADNYAVQPEGNGRFVILSDGYVIGAMTIRLSPELDCAVFDCEGAHGQRLPAAWSNPVEAVRYIAEQYRA